MKISIKIAVVETGKSEWQDGTRQAKREFNFEVPDDYEKLFDHVHFGELTEVALAEGIEEFTRKGALVPLAKSATVEEAAGDA